MAVHSEKLRVVEKAETCYVLKSKFLPQFPGSESALNNIVKILKSHMYHQLLMLECALICATQIAALASVCSRLESDAA